MNLSALDEKIGKVETLQQQVNYIADPQHAYEQLAGKNSILLESAEIDSKSQTKSIVLIDAAVRLECWGNTVFAKALSTNGESALLVLESYLGGFVTERSQQSIAFQFDIDTSNLDEDSRLKASSVFDVLRTLSQKLEAIREHSFAIFLAGVFGYDLIADFENLPEVPNGSNTCPDYVFYLAETALLIDHQTQESELLASVFSGASVAQEYFKLSQRLEFLAQSVQQLSPSPFSSETTTQSVSAIENQQQLLKVDKSDETFCDDVLTLKENILDGDIFQVVPSRTFSIPCKSASAAYHQLKLSNPSPYMFYMRDQDFSIFGASPESALKYDNESRQVEVYPIAGTRPRGKNPDGSINLDMDSRLELDLQLDEKEKAEHIMLVDLARNDIAKVSEPGSRHVKDLLKVDRYSHVMHLVSRVVGELRHDLDALHAYQACMNMGTLVGAPKISAANLIRQTENTRRGSYGGAVGYLNGRGDFDTCIVIRSAFVNNDIAHIQAGAGVVNDSVPQAEADETRAKAQAVIQSVFKANLAMEAQA